MKVHALQSEKAVSVCKVVAMICFCDIKTKFSLENNIRKGQNRNNINIFERGLKGMRVLWSRICNKN